MVAIGLGTGFTQINARTQVGKLYSTVGIHELYGFILYEAFVITEVRLGLLHSLFGIVLFCLLSAFCLFCFSSFHLFVFVSHRLNIDTILTLTNVHPI